MKVFVKLYAILRKHHPGPNRSIPLEIVLPEGATVADLVPTLNLPPELVRSAFVNNAAGELTTALHDGDHVGLFPPVVGGAGFYTPPPALKHGDSLLILRAIDRPFPAFIRCTASRFPPEGDPVQGTLANAEVFDTPTEFCGAVARLASPGSSG